MITVLLSAYACEPDRGSEPGVGWEWATRLSKHHRVLVLTRTNNRSRIEAKLRDTDRNPNLIFVYHDLPGPLLFLKKKKVLPVSAYYLLWQLGARIKGAGHFPEVDLVHHVTFNGFRFPGAWWSTSKPVILGPLGGASIAKSQFKSCFGSRWIIESIRSFTVRAWKYNIWTRMSLRDATKVFVVGEEMVQEFRTAGIESEAMLETALPFALESERPGIPSDQKRDFVLVGNLEPWKGWHLAFEAFAMALQKSGSDFRLKVIGTGGQLEEARLKAEELGISAAVEFLGQQSREETWRHVEQARGLLFPSIRDTSGNVVLEAMGLRVPVVCFNHQGVGFITNDDCAFRITPLEWRSCVEGFRDAIVALHSHDDLVENMGNAGRATVIGHFTWDAKVRRMSEVYIDVTR